MSSPSPSKWVLARNAVYDHEGKPLCHCSVQALSCQVTSTERGNQGKMFYRCRDAICEFKMWAKTTPLPIINQPASPVRARSPMTSSTAANESHQHSTAPSVAPESTPTKKSNGSGSTGISNALRTNLEQINHDIAALRHELSIVRGEVASLRLEVASLRDLVPVANLNEEAEVDKE